MPVPRDLGGQQRRSTRVSTIYRRPHDRPAKRFDSWTGCPARRHPTEAAHSLVGYERIQRCLRAGLVGRRVIQPILDWEPLDRTASIGSCRLRGWMAAHPTGIAAKNAWTPGLLAQLSPSELSALSAGSAAPFPASSSFSTCLSRAFFLSISSRSFFSSEMRSSVPSVSSK